MKTKSFFAILMIASVLTTAIVVANQKARAQNTGPRPTDKKGAAIDDASVSGRRYRWPNSLELRLV